VRASVPLSSSVVSKIVEVFLTLFFGSVAPVALSPDTEGGHAEFAPALVLVVHFLGPMLGLLWMVDWFRGCVDGFESFTLPWFGGWIVQSTLTGGDVLPGVPIVVGSG
jgi:hypothetical protein